MKNKVSELKKGFFQIDMNKMSAKQLFHFISPFIEEAGFEWELRQVTPNQELLTIAVNLRKKRKDEQEQR